AASRDRYDEPCQVLADSTGIHEAPRQRMLISTTLTLKELAHGNGPGGELDAVAVRGALAESRAPGEGRFEDGAPALVRRTVGKGTAIHFPWLPGVSYAHFAGRQKVWPMGYRKDLREFIIYPAKIAGIQPPVTADKELVETPMLLSDKGAAVTLLNWR